MTGGKNLVKMAGRCRKRKEEKGRGKKGKGLLLSLFPSSQQYGTSHSIIDDFTN
jgi:hypothetical protein